ncbi:ABC transporter ATP-binding protein [Tessaracoccus palaemonis]|uniref:ABC transporter ATP-binding protein n=1 Tax=Tessaracoccus palaemonis TaxID=2829499 RepID=A0ABX8SJY1_9ACTN|nr:ABC transporter ATP-binding protein [Tessaracoccus palaemonis]QXT63656.1 ABC transporter ATP-binding protein [Tessaracoccus palaemonis]
MTAPTIKAPVAPVLSLSGITKRFGSLTANDSISIDITPGKIHCLLGENGAGKSTLMNILFGLLAPDDGEIRLGERQLSLTNPKQAMAAGIGMVHQHFMLIPVFTVAENMVLGHEPGPGGLLDLNSARKRVRELSERYRLEVDPDALVEDLPVGIQQRVEILKALANDATYLIFDEPTAVLTPQEIDELMEVMRSLRDEGRAIVFITHKLREVREVADEITVIRRGKVVGEALPSASQAELASMMVGRSVSLQVAKEKATPGEPRLVIEDLTVASPSGQVAVDQLDLTVRGGEIVCIAGVQGNGQTELAETLLGTMTPLSGTITLDGDDITRQSPAKTLKAGLGYVPEDRHRDGFVGEFSIAENLVLDNLDEYSNRGSLQLGRIADNARARIEEFDIRAGSHTQPVNSLSGGNQQKVVLARELSRPLSLLLASQPTRGVDVGAIEFLHSRIVSERDKGTAVLIVSTELEEVESLADRIAVMYRGRIVGVVDSDTPRDVLGLMMAGISYEEALATIKESTHE